MVIGKAACITAVRASRRPLRDLLSMREANDGVEKEFHPEAPREARPRRTHGTLPPLAPSVAIVSGALVGHGSADRSVGAVRRRHEVGGNSTTRATARQAGAARHLG